MSASDDRPLIKLPDGSIIVTLPSAISVAARNFLIHHIVDNKLENAFDSALSAKYSELLKDTPIFGGPIGAPVYWRTVGKL